MLVSDSCHASAIGVGGDFAAVASDKRWLRLFSHSGYEVGVMGLPGDVVCVAGWESLIAVVFHRDRPAGSDQHLGIWVKNE